MKVKGSIWLQQQAQNQQDRSGFKIVEEMQHDKRESANQELTAHTNQDCFVYFAKIEMHFWFPCMMVNMEFCSYSSISAEMVDKTRRGAMLGRVWQQPHSWRMTGARGRSGAKALLLEVCSLVGLTVLNAPENRCWNIDEGNRLKRKHKTRRYLHWRAACIESKNNTVREQTGRCRRTFAYTEECWAQRHSIFIHNPLLSMK